MPLTPGSKLGAYEIVAPIGAGGMGEVYRARDTRLGRDVAIKALPEAFVSDPERAARFEREAQLLAALNHPHIAGIYGLEDAGGSRVLVLEFVDGDSLAQRLAAGGRLPVDEVLTVARQIIDALEAAHEKGIIHRDLKPANIMLTADGSVKVLDFGLAKLEPGGSAESGRPGALTHSPTLTFAATQAGMILGTAAYMSPEQAKGRAADKRSDVWSFGCVVFEMLTGRRAFEGEDVSDTLAAILRGEPDWNAIPADVPAHVRTIVKQCLARDRKMRIPEIAIVRFMLDQPPAIPPPAPTPTGHRERRSVRVWQIATALLLLTTLAGGSAWYINRSAPRPVTRFLVQPPENGMFANGTAIRVASSAAVSPDGEKLALTVRDSTGRVQLWIRPIDSLTAQPLAGTEGASYPFWSPDSRFIAYSTQGKLMKVAANGGPPQTLCAYSGPTILGRGGAWNRDGMIVFNNGPGPLFRISSAGGQASPVGKLPTGLTSLNFPSFLPDGHHIVAYGQSQSASENDIGLYALSLDTGEAKWIASAESGAVFARQEGVLLFVRQGTLLAQPFDPATSTLSGEPVAVADRLETIQVPGFTSFSISATGTLAYGVSGAGGAMLQLSWVDRTGKQLQSVGPPANYRGIDLSRDGTRIAAHHHDRTLQGDLWITELARGTTSRFTYDASQENSSPVWSPDGNSIAYGSLRQAKWGLYRRPTNNAGAEERLLDSDDTLLPQAWSPDGQSIVFTRFGTQPPDLWLLPLSGDRKPIVLLDGAFVETYGQVSPDGRWLAYTSTETGTGEVYVQPFPRGAGKWKVSTNGGTTARWRQDGRELFYLTQQSGGKMMVVDVGRSGTTFEATAPKELFDSALVNLPHNGPYYPYAVSPDGQRFLIAQSPGSSTQASAPVVVVINWAAQLKP